MGVRGRPHAGLVSTSRALFSTNSTSNIAIIFSPSQQKTPESLTGFGVVKFAVGTNPARPLQPASGKRKQGKRKQGEMIHWKNLDPATRTAAARFTNLSTLAAVCA